MVSERIQTINRVRQTKHFPVVIVGAGINGIGTFRDLTEQGVDCLLVDKSDFCAGASGASSRMIHGGLKYLETGELRLVWESLSERDRLLRNAPHALGLVEFVIMNKSWLGGVVSSTKRFFGFQAPLGGRGTLVSTLGLLAYDLLALRSRTFPRHRFYSRASFIARFRGIRSDLVSALSYHDALIRQPERLGIELVLDSLSANQGSAALNHVRMTGISGNKIQLQDEIDGQRLEVSTSVMINAGGAWIDDVNCLARLDSKLIYGTKGSHIVLNHPELESTLGAAVLCFEAGDGRECFAYVLYDRVVVGSTDLKITDPDSVRCEPDEIEYILNSLQQTFPDLSFDCSQIVYTYCGVRPLAHAPVDDPSELSRSHSISVVENSESCTFPIVSLIGGKWTTFRSFSEEAADRVLMMLGILRQTSTKSLAIGGGRYDPSQGPAQLLQSVKSALQGTDARVLTLIERYGSMAPVIARYCRNNGDVLLKSEASFSCPEIEFLTKTEQTYRVCDILKRRTNLAVRGVVHDEVIEEIAQIMGSVQGWSQERIQNEARIARDELSNFNLI